MNYPKGNEAFSAYIRKKENIDTFPKFIDAITMLTNIADGIRLLQNNDLIHMTLNHQMVPTTALSN